MGDHYEDRYAFDRFECVHDLRLVWPSAIQGLFSLEGNSRKLAYRICRILFSGTGKPDRTLPVFRRAAQDNPRGDNACGICCIFPPVPERRV